MSLNSSNLIFNYPSPSEVKIYIGNNNWVDDAYRIDYTVTNNRTPLYDYTSRLYKDVAEGHSIVQGQLIINYRFPGYLVYAINDKLQKDPGIVRSLDQAAELFRDLSKGSSADKVRKLMIYKKLGAMNNAKQFANTLYGDGSSTQSKTTSRVMTQTNMVPGGFDIHIRYGGEEALYTKIIRACQVIGESQVISAAAIGGGDMSSSGMPILEVYTFFGKEIEDRVETKAMSYQASLKNFNNTEYYVPSPDFIQSFDPPTIAF